MEAEKRPRRKPKKPKVENYYKSMGLRSNAKQESIKPKYIELVRANPPETHPEEFQQIRRAYEVLRDPQKRSEYDLMRKYGNQIEAVLEEALEKMDNEQWAKAAELFGKALLISPNNISAGIGLARAAIMQGDHEAAQQQFKDTFDAAATEEEKVTVAIWHAKLLLDNEHAEEALEMLERVEMLYPQQASRLENYYMHIYMHLGRKDEAWSLVQMLIPSVEMQEPDDIRLFIDYINIFIEMKKWNLWSQVQSRTKKFLNSIRTKEDESMVVSVFMNEYYSYYEVGRIKEAEIYIDFAFHVQPKDPIIQKLRRDVQKLARLEREIDRMFMDHELFPLVMFQAYQWVYEDIVEGDQLSQITGMFPPSLLTEMQAMPEQYAAGIMRLKKKYPLVYREFQVKWDDLYKERVAGLNRESRRRLK